MLLLVALLPRPKNDLIFLKKEQKDEITRSSSPLAASGI
jgi:hypothetical protein